MAYQILPIVGAHFRPPAKAFIQSMPVGQLLLLRREPSNPYDENAIMVRVVTAVLPAEGTDSGAVFWEDFLAISVGMGFDKEAIDAEDEWHLGYIPKVEAVLLAETFDVHGKDVVGTFGYDAAGKPTITFDSEITYAEDGEDVEDEDDLYEEDEEEDEDTSDA